MDAKPKFYIEPPYDCEPSVAELLSCFSVSKNGIVADVFYLDKLGKVEIDEYFDSSITIRLKNCEGLDDNLLYLWNFMKGRSSGGLLRMEFSEFRNIESEYEKLVITEAGRKFGTAIRPGAGLASVPFFGFAFLGFITSTALNMLLAIPVFFLSIMGETMLGLGQPSAQGATNNVTAFEILNWAIYTALCSLLLMALSRRKLSGSPIERKFLYGEIMLSFAKVVGLSSLYSFLFFAAQGVLGGFGGLAAGGFCIAILLYPVFAYVYFTALGRIAYKFFYWLSENRESAEHRRKWLEFRQFVVENSEIENLPPKYYELWGEFYYYALAVGAMRKRLA